MTIDLIIKNAATKLANDYDTSDASSAENKKLPNRDIIIKILKDIRRLIFPGYFGDESVMDVSADYFAGNLMTEIYRELKGQIETALMYQKAAEERPRATERAAKVCGDLIERIPEIRRLLLRDVDAGYNGDPAAKSKAEIIVSYPGLFAIFVYRIAHILYEKNIPLIPRIMTEYAHSRTGIDINAGAVIGENFFIDHGTGVVIGETTIIGNNVKLYQGVTLGALSTRSGQELSGVKRHPTIGDNVTIYANATILGGETIIGNGAIIGGSCFITKSVPDDTKVSVKKPEMIFKGSKHEAALPDGKWEI